MLPIFYFLLFCYIPVWLLSLPFHHCLSGLSAEQRWNHTLRGICSGGGGGGSDDDGKGYLPLLSHGSEWLTREKSHQRGRGWLEPAAVHAVGRTGMAGKGWKRNLSYEGRPIPSLVGLWREGLAGSNTSKCRLKTFCCQRQRTTGRSLHSNRGRSDWVESHWPPEREQLLLTLWIFHQM